MKSCCENKSAELAVLRSKQAGVLKAVLAINATMFVVEATTGFLSKSTSLLADSLDMFGDSVVYAFSLFVLHKSQTWRSGAALLKGVIMVIFGLGVLLDAILKIYSDLVPVGQTITLIGLIALVANSVCLVLLIRHKDDDLNMKSTWICSRNDIIANVGVIGAGALVMVLGSKWPDIVVGLGIAAVFLVSATGVVREALSELKPKAVET